jgi:IS5 family transposase
MIANFDDFVTAMYCSIDEVWQHLAPLFARPGPVPDCSDSELITMAVVGECRGWDQETELISNWQERRDLFPLVPERSRFNRRRRALQQAINLIRCFVLARLDRAQDRHCAVDSLPVPVVQFHLVPQASREWAAHGATFGKVVTKQQTIFGYKLHLLVTLNGVIVDFHLAPAHVADRTVGAELLAEHTDLTVLGDKGYISAPLAAELAETNQVHLLTPLRRNQKQQLPRAVIRLLNAKRQIIETVHDQLTEQFHIDSNHAYSFWGLCARLHTKLAAHTLCIYLNRLMGKVDCLQIKRLAFPI